MRKLPSRPHSVTFVFEMFRRTTLMNSFLKRLTWDFSINRLRKGCWSYRSNSPNRTRFLGSNNRSSCDKILWETDLGMAPCHIHCDWRVNAVVSLIPWALQIILPFLSRFVLVSFFPVPLRDLRAQILYSASNLFSRLEQPFRMQLNYRVVPPHTSTSTMRLMPLKSVHFQPQNI